MEAALYSVCARSARLQLQRAQASAGWGGRGFLDERARAGGRLVILCFAVAQRTYYHIRVRRENENEAEHVAPGHAELHHEFEEADADSCAPACLVSASAYAPWPSEAIDRTDTDTAQ